ncbi:MAG: hypothetical protein WC627_06130 [Legionella sp.]
MLAWLKKLNVKKNKGFTVQFIGESLIRYSEEQHTIDMKVDHGDRAGKSVLYIFETEFNNWNDGQKISAEKQHQIQQNIIDEMQSKNVIVVVIKVVTFFKD